MEMEDQYGISDLRQFITRAAAGGPQFPLYGQQQQQQPSSLSDLLTAHHHHRSTTTTAAAAAAQQQQQQLHHQYGGGHHNNEMVVMGRHMGAAAAAAGDILHHHHHHIDGSGGGSSGGVRQYQDHFNCDSTTTTATQQGNNFDGGDGGAARWPRQETLTLLEIRSRLDHKFKEANQKGPLWDEVARIMCEEHGYQRSGKKCREKFENLYKYYKKTKEGKAGRQDGKHYRFFRQLEALYGEHHHHHNHPNSTSEPHITGNTPQFHSNHPLISPHQQGTSTALARPTSVSLSNSSDFETSSSEEDDMNGSMESNGSMLERSKKQKRRPGKRSWKAKIKEFIDLQMRKIMEKQEAWVEKMMCTLESRERERMAREEEWRKQEADRVDREHKFWATERAWIESRDSALMSALEKLTNTNTNTNTSTNSNSGLQWPEHEVTRLIQVRTSMESRFQQCGFSEEVLWDDIATKMAYLGYDRSPIVCKEKWDSINTYFRDKGKIIIKDEGKKKRKENYGANTHNHNHNHDNNNTHHQSNNNDQGGIYMNELNAFNNCEINEPVRLQLNEGSSSPSSHNSNVNVNNVSVAAAAGGGGNNVMNESCFRFFQLGDHGEAANTLGWESNSTINYGLNKLNKGENLNQCA